MRSSIAVSSHAGCQADELGFGETRDERYDCAGHVHMSATHKPRGYCNRFSKYIATYVYELDRKIQCRSHLWTTAQSDQLIVAKPSVTQMSNGCMLIGRDFPISAITGRITFTVGASEINRPAISELPLALESAFRDFDINRQDCCFCC